MTPALSPTHTHAMGSRHSQECYPILFHYYIHYIDILPRSVVSIYVRVCMYMLYMLYIFISYSLLYKCCLVKCKIYNARKPYSKCKLKMRMKYEKWMKKKMIKCSSTRNIISKSNISHDSVNVIVIAEELATCSMYINTHTHPIKSLPPLP